VVLALITLGGRLLLVKDEEFAASGWKSVGGWSTMEDARRGGDEMLWS
jgi:hypothetical protein